MRRRRRQFERKRGTATDRGYTWDEWGEYSQRYRQLHPWCAIHLERGGIKVPTYCVDHIVPVPKTDPRFWDPANHRSLCRSCNAKNL